MLKQPPAPVAPEQAQRLVQATPIQVGIQIAQTRRQAPPHLSVGGRMVSPREPPPAVPESEDRIELLDQLSHETVTAQRADGHRVARGGLARHLKDRERDIQAAA